MTAAHRGSLIGRLCYCSFSFSNRKVVCVKLKSIGFVSEITKTLYQ